MSDSERETLQGALTNVLSNASNYPENVQSRLLGQDMGPLNAKVADAVLALGFRLPVSAGAEPEWEYGTKYQIDDKHHEFTLAHSETQARKWASQSPTDTWLHRRNPAGAWIKVEPETN